MTPHTPKSSRRPFPAPAPSDTRPLGTSAWSVYHLILLMAKMEWVPQVLQLPVEV
jgi:hypothetical protein